MPSGIFLFLAACYTLIRKGTGRSLPHHLPKEGYPVLDLLFSAQSAGQAVPIPAWLDLAAVVVGSLTGCIVAAERKLDLVGFVGLSILCGLGGGLLRDMAMQQGGVYLIDSPYAIPGSVAIAAISFIFPSPFFRNPRALEWFDILSVSLFAVSGTDKAMLYQLSPWAAVLMGTLTAVGGGMLRDVFLGDIPRIFRKSNLYALCAVAGSLSYFLAACLGLNKVVDALICIIMTVGLRRASLRYNIMSPADVDLTPKVQDKVHAAERRVERLRVRGGGARRKK